jgi:hypothetical protein
MSSRLISACVFCVLLAGRALSAETTTLAGRMEGGIYVSATGEFKVAAPVLPELGGVITDTENVVTFSDSFNTHVSIACFPQDASQKWELETRGRRDYLLYFFTDFVLADFRQRFPGSKIESARYVPELQDGTLIAYALLPGGSFFETKNSIMGTPPADPVTAKRGSMLFVHNAYVYVLSIELAERVTERSTYHLTVEKENALLTERLTALAGRLTFTAPKPRAP